MPPTEEGFRMSTTLCRAIRAKRLLLRWSLLSVLMVGFALQVRAQSIALPLQIRQLETTYNLQSQRGVPISNVISNPPGSDGRMSLTNESTGLIQSPQSGQFKGLLSMGAVPGLTQSRWKTLTNSASLNAGTSNLFSALATDMKRPLAQDANGNVVLVLRSGSVGAPYFSRQVTLSFGDEILPPLTDEAGLPLVGIGNTAYWRLEPYTTNNHANMGYYWSPHAQKLYATQPGPISAVWIRNEGSSTKPAGQTNVNFIVLGSTYYPIFKVNYVVAGASVKPPRNIYWTERGFRSLSKPIAIPAARVGAVNIVFNNSFKDHVDEEYSGPGDTSPTDGNTNITVLHELRTLWYDRQQGNIYAYNAEGRVFVELLGDPSADGNTRTQLGFEIVDVSKYPNPEDVTVELGERVPPPNPDDRDILAADPVLQPGGGSFAYQHTVSGNGNLELYATHTTANLNDYQVFWMETGVAGLKWPAHLGRYTFIWPQEESHYVHYVRPEVATEAEARTTAVPLPTLNAPALEYQDPLDQPRGKLTETFAYYSFLDREHPAHRALIRYNVGEHVAFERVFSWLNSSLLRLGPALSNTVYNAGDFTHSVATQLNSFTTNQTFYWPDALTIPRVVRQTVEIGERLSPPDGEPTLVRSTVFPAGYVNASAGTLFNTHAYLDPFAVGFDVAAGGAIIPVNDIPGQNTLEVWWFRPNAARLEEGFLSTYWPSAVGYYTIVAPATPNEIVLASNQGSNGDRPLDSLEAGGSIYYQNDPSQAGYNPNEEHAILSGGAVYATRDDLNITNGASYSSQPLVLLEYRDQSGRPAMSTFRVLREKASQGWFFDYVVTAGLPLEPPMPLPLLQKPVEMTSGSLSNYNTEPDSTSGDLPGGWNPGTSPSGTLKHYAQFTYTDRKNGLWVYRGLHSGPPELNAGRYSLGNRVFQPLTVATGVVGKTFEFTVHVSQEEKDLELRADSKPTWLELSGLRISGTPGSNDIGSSSLQLIVNNPLAQSSVTNTLLLTVVGNPSAPVVGQAPLAISSTNSYTGSVAVYTNRPPFLAVSPNPSNSFTMRFYYKTEPGFAFPGVANPPAVGSIVPYLRAVDADGAFVGQGASKATPSLDIVYRPVWPLRDPLDSSKPLATLPYGLTLTKPKLGLPGIKDWKTARVLYQQSVARNIATPLDSVVLFDPTREKVSPLSDVGLQQLPSSIRQQPFQGKTYFPNLPPHLVGRLFFDPARGNRGSFVLRGEEKASNPDDAESANLLLNVIRGADLDTVQQLCSSQDADYSRWLALIAGMHTRLETFVENPDQPGAFIPGDSPTLIDLGSLPEVESDDVAVDSYALSATGPGAGYVTLVEGGGVAFTQPGDPVTLHVMKVGGSLYPGRLTVINSDNPLSENITFQHTLDLGGRTDEFEYQWKIQVPADGQPPDCNDDDRTCYLSLIDIAADIQRYVLGGSGIRVLGDNYVILRYRPIHPTHPFYRVWSEWTQPALAEGWIKRVLAGINPFNQRTTDLFNNSANTEASILTQAGHRWEGDIALNSDTINNYGLIEIYETVLRRGRGISIEKGYNYGPANDALLLAAGYLNDLYVMYGNEAWADAANPTIGIGTANNTYGDIATALFAFKGQVPTLLEEELALVRGRDDFLVPGVRNAPVYNRLVWNYTRGIDAGEAIYALNYNIQEDPDHGPDGVVDAKDAARMFPQGHGDAYGHYLTALKGYYSLFMDTDFDWVPRVEAVTILGQPVSVDYQDERKFAAAAAALGRAGQRIVDLTWRRDYQPGHAAGWHHFSPSRTNATTQVESYWGLDHWAARAGLGNFIHWVAGNSMLPDVDPNPAHEGIQKIDRTTVPELTELATLATDLQTAIDNAEAGITPLGLPGSSVALDINPNTVVGANNNTHFEQIYSRAKVALNNAVAAFDDAKDVTRLMRSEQDSLAGVQAAVAQQELAFNNALIELYGTPYTDDIGPGKTYVQNYAGPDLVHYNYVETPESRLGQALGPIGKPITNRIDIQQLPKEWTPDFLSTTFDFYVSPGSKDYTAGTHYLEFVLDPHNFSKKPSTWTGRRVSPGEIQQSISGLIAAHSALQESLAAAEQDSRSFAQQVALFRSYVDTGNAVGELEAKIQKTQQILQAATFANDAFGAVNDFLDTLEDKVTEGAIEGLPKVLIAGTAVGGDGTSAGRATLKLTEAASFSVRQTAKMAGDFVVKALDFSTSISNQWIEANLIGSLQGDLDLQNRIAELARGLAKVQSHYAGISASLRSLDDSQRKLDGLIAKGDRIQLERQVARQRTAAIIQGYRTRDAAFRIFRNEKLERYQTLFDLAARYAFLTANAYDYETGLLNSQAGRNFISRIVNARALGVVRSGEPQFAGSNLGDPGLSSVLAEMQADWNVVKGRLGFNNPDAYGTTVSLRTENFRILPNTNGDTAWIDLLNRCRQRDILADQDVTRHCLQISRGDGLPVPGIIIEFSTTIATGLNLFGVPLASGDHAFSASSFATKLFSVGIALEGYRGMDEPAANGSSGGASPSDPSLWFLDPLGLSATPYVYLIPVGVDSMRSPPIGDAGVIREFAVEDVAIPLPFNIGAIDFASGGLYLSSDSLSEPLFATRKHQGFRPVPSASFFSTSLYGNDGSLQRSQYTNNRLIGRSAWNSRWKLIIPGHTLLNDPDEGLERFIQTVRDIKLHFVTYSYSGN